MNKLKLWFSKFMYGRYGGDALGRFLSFATLVPLILSMLFMDSIAGMIMWVLAIGMLVWMYLRMFSRNISARSRENQKYLSLHNRVIGTFRGARNRFRQRKEYKFFRCPKCHAWLRVPRGRGKIRINCRNCSTMFDAKS